MPIYHNTGTGWHRVERWSYSSEDELERFLLDNPGFIVGERDDVWTVWARHRVVQRLDCGHGCRMRLRNDDRPLRRLYRG